LNLKANEMILNGIAVLNERKCNDFQLFDEPVVEGEKF